jgi:TFIIF-interacting CTD phosphatase-like protein
MMRSGLRVTALNHRVTQVSNGIPITSWYDNVNDTELMAVLTFLETVRNVEDVR